MLVLPLLALALAGPHPLMQEYNRAWQLFWQRRAGEAIPLLKAIIAKDKTFYRAYEYLARAYSQQKQPEVGERYFRSLVIEKSDLTWVPGVVFTLPEHIEELRLVDGQGLGAARRRTCHPRR